MPAGPQVEVLQLVQEDPDAAQAVIGDLGAACQVEADQVLGALGDLLQAVVTDLLAQAEVEVLQPGLLGVEGVLQDRVAQVVAATEAETGEVLEADGELPEGPPETEDLDALDAPPVQGWVDYAVGLAQVQFGHLICPGCLAINSISPVPADLQDDKDGLLAVKFY